MYVIVRKFSQVSNNYHALLSGVCFALAVSIPPLWWLILPAFITFFLTFKDETSLKKICLLGWVIGFLKVLVATAWFWQAFPLQWIEIDQFVGFIYICIFWLAISLVGGIGVILPALYYRFFKSRTILILLTFPVIWLVGEVAFSFFESVLLLGPGSTLNIAISHSYTGVALAFSTIFLPVASLAGLYSLTFLSALLGISSFLLLQRSKYGWFGLLLVGVLLAVGFSLTQDHQVDVDKKIITIDTYFFVSMMQTDAGYKTKQEEILQAIKEALDQSPDVIILPEDSRLTPYFSDSGEALTYLQNLDKESDALIIESARIDRPDGTAILRAYYYDLSAGKVYEIDKQLLVPQGEYVPYVFYPLLLLGDKGLVEQIERDRNYVRGPKVSYENFPSGLPFLLFCYESASPFVAWHSSLEKKSDYIVHVTSHDWFTNPYLLHWQLDAMLQAQSLWSSLPIVSAGNMNEGKTYLPDGSILEGKVLKESKYWRLVEYNF